MKQFKVKFRTIEDIQSFCQLVQNPQFDETDIDVALGRYVVDAKSTLAIFSLDMSKEIIVTVHDDVLYKKIIDSCKKWLIE